MNVETTRTKPKWYHLSHWRWIPPGGYYGGFFAGVGLTMMIFKLAMWHGVLPDGDTIFGVGLAMFMISNVVCHSLERLHETKQDKVDG
jgi:hypothetical protein